MGFSKAAINFCAVNQENQLAIYSEGYGCTVLYWTVVVGTLKKSDRTPNSPLSSRSM